MIGRKRRRREKEAAIQLRRSCILIFISVIPAKRESRDFSDLHWVPAFAGTTNLPGSQVFLTAARKRGPALAPGLNRGCGHRGRCRVAGNGRSRHGHCRPQVNYLLLGTRRRHAQRRIDIRPTIAGLRRRLRPLRRRSAGAVAPRTARRPRGLPPPICRGWSIGRARAMPCRPSLRPPSACRPAS